MSENKTLNYYIPTYFEPYELVDPDTYAIYESLGNTELIYTLFDPDVLRAADMLREKYGSVTINNWKSGGNRKWSGLRNPKSPNYSKGSMHTVGKALDMVFSKVSTEQIRKDLKEKKTVINYIKRVEDNVSWLHIDTKDTGLNDIYFFKV